MASINTKNMSQEAWLELRKQGIGGSDAGAILGVNKWKSPLQLYFEKTGMYEVKQSDNEFIYWGHVLEDVVAKEFTVRTGKKVRRVNQMFVHAEHDYMIANIDRAVIGESALLECKVTSEYNKDEWKSDEVPGSYIAQVQHYLAVTGYEKAYIAVLIGGNKFVWKEIEKDEELIDYIIEQEQDFWNRYILGDEMPPMDGSDATTNFLKDQYKDSVDNQITLDNNAATLIKALDAIKAEEDVLKERKQKYKNELKDKLRENEVGITNGYRVTWKKQMRKDFDKKAFAKDYPDLVEKYTKTSSYRVFNTKQISS
ncbi:YqaJ viral recombinase family nuclease [Staphylococcus xylosus]